MLAWAGHQLWRLRWQRQELLLPPPPPPLSFFEQLLHLPFHGFALWGGGATLTGTGPALFQAEQVARRKLASYPEVRRKPSCPEAEVQEGRALKTSPSLFSRSKPRPRLAKGGAAPHGGSCGEAGRAPGQVRSGTFRAVGLPRAGWTPFPLQTTEGMDQRVLEPQLHCWGLDTRILVGLESICKPRPRLKRTVEMDAGHYSLAEDPGPISSQKCGLRQILNLLCPSVLIHEMGIMIVPASQG